VKVTEAERATVLAEFTRRGWPELEALHAVQIESGWDPAAHHPVTKAGGLIGFMPFIMKRLGWPAGPEAFWRLSAAAQAPYVGKYLDLTGKRWRVPGDTYVALAAPAHVGEPDHVIVYPRGTKAWELNPGWRGPGGEITVGSIRQTLLRRMAGKLPRAAQAPAAASLVPVALLALAAWFFWRARAR
jgi:hypothetical protein